MKTSYLMALALFLATTAARAMPIYNYSTIDFESSLASTSPNGGFNPAGGNVTELNTSFDGTNFSWNYQATPSEPRYGSSPSNYQEQDNDGFWLVVSDGPNPKAGPGNTDAPSEYAILYGDFARNNLVAYIYDGKNNPGSFGDQNNYLQTFENALLSEIDANGNTNVSFNIDVTAINNAASQAGNDLWEGISFDNEIGIWFHPSVNTTITYDGDFISSYSGTVGWMDTNGALITTEVPEPGTLALLGLGMLGLGRIRKSV